MTKLILEQKTVLSLHLQGPLLLPNSGFVFHARFWVPPELLA